jgi:hypothetical protein
MATIETALTALADDARATSASASKSLVITPADVWRESKSGLCARREARVRFVRRNRGARQRVTCWSA